MLRSTFHGLNISSMGLFTAQKQIDVAGHNISNANTVGYSRQRYILSAVEPKGYLSQLAPIGRGMVGGGVGTLSLDQIRDRFLDVQYREEFSKSAYWNSRAETMYYVEDIFNGINETSLDAVISQFFNALQELSKNPTDEAIRTNVVAQAKKMIDAFRMYHDQLTSLMEQQNANMVQQAKHINELLDRLTTLNDNIKRFEIGGNIANDLRDERNLILDELSSYMDITYTEVSYEPPLFNIHGIELTQLQVYVGAGVGDDYEDMLLVRHMEAFHLDYGDIELEYDESGETGLNEVADANGVVTHALRLASGVDFSREDIDGLDNGILLNYLDLRDSLSVERPGLPYFITQLDVMVSALVQAFNDIHQNGNTMPFSSPDGSSDSVSGVNFFDPDGVTAATIALDEAILLSAFNIAASSEMVTMGEDGHWQTGNNENALDMIGFLKENREDFLQNYDISSFEGFFKNFLGNLASEVALANNMRDAQEVLVASIDKQRNAIMSVSEDEELTDLIRFQHAYNAAARCITTMDEALDKLINGTGRVGL
ncbi:MAG: flagellar hook-associated protein FlgK [Oscillospiraceae bacterium]|nr:flagellar hook-associated protein FlgK [Oscillospiraceae bacterium]